MRNNLLMEIEMPLCLMKTMTVRSNKTMRRMKRSQLKSHLKKSDSLRQVPVWENLSRSRVHLRDRSQEM